MAINDAIRKRKPIMPGEIYHLGPDWYEVVSSSDLDLAGNIRPNLDESPTTVVTLRLTFDESKQTDNSPEEDASQS